MEIEYRTAHILKTITIKEAVQRLKAHGWPGNESRLRAGIAQGAYPFGTCVHMTQDEYEVYAGPLDKWIEERLCEVSVPFIPQEVRA